MTTARDAAIRNPPSQGGSSSRRTAAQIFADAVEVGEEELKRSSPGLAFSGFAAGLGMGLSGLGSPPPSEMQSEVW